ncbi:MAG: GldG family protein [Hyphomonadaceae bacterium]|nr:GldG family protein [Hyphomonadaceae bacterium]
MSARRYALVVFAALVVIFLASNVIVSSWFAGARLDLTENRLYSISKGTRDTLRELNEPITLTFYYSRDAAAPYPQVRTYGARVRELLQTYQRRSGGKVRVVEVDPVRFTDAEDEAVAAGLQPLNPEAGADPIFLGITGANAVDEKVTIPQLSWDREPFLEYELTRLIAELQSTGRPKVGLITALGWNPSLTGGDPRMAAQSGQPFVVGELARLVEIEKLAPDFTGIGPEIDVLAIVHPWALTEQQLYEIDQFMMRKGRAFVAVDPAAIMTEGAPNPFGMPQDAAPSSSNLAPILEKWGVAVSADAVIDRIHALPIQAMGPNGQPMVMPQPLFFEVPADRLNREDLVTAALARGINVGAPGAITWTSAPGVEVTPLARTSGDTMRIPAAQATSRPDPATLLQQYVGSARQETLAVRIAGTLPSAFGAQRPGTIAAAPDAPHLAQSAEPATVILVSDVDFLNDNFYLSGQQRQALVDNASLLLNAIDQLGGSTALLSLRSRAPSLRRMTVVEGIRNDAQARMVETQAVLQGELAAAEQGLQELEAKGQGSGFFAGDLGAELTAEERARIEDFRAKALELRKQLRAVERGFRTDLDRLEGWLILLNVWLAPLLVIGAGVFWILRRQRRAAGSSVLAVSSPKTGAAP